MTRPTPILAFDSIGKGFFGIPVLKQISFELAPGRVLGLIGENGAGKSTLMNILGGVFRPDTGRMWLDGQAHEPRSPREAARSGIAFVHQELNLFTNLSVAENIHLENFPLRRLGPIPLPLVSRRRMGRTTEELLAAVELRCSPDTLVEDLSPGERQLVEIAKALSGSARIVILDEPTTSLTAPEAQRLFAIIDRLRNQGIAIIYISHNLEDVFGRCDDLVILRDGQVVGQGPTGEFGLRRAISLMVGRSVEQLYPVRQAGPGEEVVLEATGVSRGQAVRQVSFTLHRGEVLGVAGLMGAGRTELARVLFGLDPLEAGRIRLDGQDHKPSPGRSIRRGMAFVTENRREEGLLMEASIRFNASLVSLPSFARGGDGWIDGRRLNEAVSKTSESIHLGGVALADQAAKTLSGGNQQKVVLAKWLLERPAVFILDEPTRGIDIGAKQEVYRIINHLAGQGVGILMISSEIEELIGLCDRILVMAGGRICDCIARGEFDRERILRSALAGGRA